MVADKTTLVHTFRVKMAKLQALLEQVGLALHDSMYNVWSFGTQANSLGVQSAQPHGYGVTTLHTFSVDMATLG